MQTYTFPQDVSIGLYHCWQLQLRFYNKMTTSSTTAMNKKKYWVPTYLLKDRMLKAYDQMVITDYLSPYRQEGGMDVCFSSDRLVTSLHCPSAVIMKTAGDGR
jgi:hypothetical protein